MSNNKNPLFCQTMITNLLIYCRDKNIIKFEYTWKVGGNMGEIYILTNRNA